METAKLAKQLEEITYMMVTCKQALPRDTENAGINGAVHILERIEGELVDIYSDLRKEAGAGALNRGAGRVSVHIHIDKAGDVYISE